MTYSDCSVVHAEQLYTNKCNLKQLLWGPLNYNVMLIDSEKKCYHHESSKKNLNIPNVYKLLKKYFANCP